jgi:transposase
MTKENQQELAKILYMQNMSNKDIATKVGITEKTVGVWIDKYSWKEHRASMQVSRQQLINKALNQINVMLQNGDVNPDALNKMASLIEKIDKQSNVVDYVQTFVAFSKWCVGRSFIDSKMTDEQIKFIDTYQDIFVNEHFK